MYNCNYVSSIYTPISVSIYILKIMINLKKTFQEEKEMLDIMIEYYLIKRNFIISILFLIQHNCILSRLSSVQKSI